MVWDLKTIGIVIAIFFFGYIIGLVEAAIKQRIRNEKKPREEQKESQETVEKPSEEAKGADLMRLNRDPSNKLVLNLEGEQFAKKEELSPENRRKVVNLLVELRPWLETPAPAEISPSEKESTASGETETHEEQVVPELPKPKPVLVIKDPAARQPGSIVAQIDGILQARLAGSPLANQGIRLVESVTGGVIVYVGLQKFEGIDALPDPNIQAFIRQAVADWEKQT